MHDFLIALGGMAYGAIAFRAAYVIVRARERYGVSGDKFIAAMYGLMWPATLTMIGFSIGLSGEAGVFCSSLASEESRDA
jgi:hypothetical protein